MNAARTVAQVRADAERSGRSGECEMGEHSFCHPQDVYASSTRHRGELPLFTLRCTCACHKAPPPDGR
ncbi:hypothetical protein QCN29_08020 [Streptomyces sp. HNM0663]|uniref:Uncharacterized protein n=1 Tax=Streptomyces chengmaiensis TaxID=3040919 RepID=A0ABT6HJ67_9ACTN|nr:hypothetical protein [Streptomyces chengmaiensis]MDH2388733.1 hypothetical protein [Streptomyces chengmaiensis]